MRMRPIQATDLSASVEPPSAHGKLALLEAALDCQSTGTAVFGPAGTAIFANHAMRRIAERGDGISFDDRGRLRIAGVKDRINPLILAVLQGGVGGIAVTPRASGGTPYVARVVSGGSTASRTLSRPGGRSAILTVHDPASLEQEAEDILRQGLGLTPAGARLVAALAADNDLKSFSERHGVTINTARFHLRDVFVRTGTRSQSQLIRMAVRMLRDLGYGIRRDPRMSR